MKILDKIITLSRKTAASFLRGERPVDLEESKLLNKKEKEEFLNRLADESKMEEHVNFINSIDVANDWKIVKRKIQRASRISMYWTYGIAASVISLIAITYILVTRQPQGNDATLVNSADTEIKIGTDKATLTLADGTEVALEKGTSYQTRNASSNGEEIVYAPAGRSQEQQTTNNKQRTTNNEPLVYNYLTIPRGGQFYVKLSDGTEVWLNSESRLKYPVAFAEGKTREVELVYGEAYFEVSPSTEHQGATFKVRMQAQEVEVLGTEFNIKAYKDEATIYTTLVEGKVAVSHSTAKQDLVPNQQAKLDRNTNTLTIAPVDVYNETSWKKGLFSFKEKPLVEIMKVLSRWYDIDSVAFENAALEKVKFDGVLSKDQNIKDILGVIKDIGYITDYEITAKTITIQ